MNLAPFGGRRAELPTFVGIAAQYDSPPLRCKLLFGLLAVASWLTLTTGPVSGSAFSIAENGARATGMGTAFTSVADDGSALFYNPAGIAFSEGMNFQMDNLAVVGLFRFVPSDPAPGTSVPEKGFSGSIKPKFIPVGSLYFTKKLSERLAFGFGMFAPFGLAANFTNFNDSDPALTKYTGRFAGTRAKLESFWFQPTVAYKLTKNSSVAVGLALVHTHLLIESSFLNPKDDALDFGREAAATVFPGVDKEQAARVIARLLPEGRSRIAGTANSPGFNLGYLYKKPDGKFNFGFMFRSAVTNHLKGKASFAFGTGYALEKFVGEDLLFKAFPNQDITGSFTTPATYSAGVSRKGPFDSLISFDMRLQDYKRFASVPLNFSKTVATDKAVRTPAERRLIFDFRNSWVAAVGMEKKMRPDMSMRLGYIFDRSPVVDKSVGPLFPDSDRHSFTLGATKTMRGVDFTMFYEAMQFVNRTVNVPANNIQGTNGEYRNFAHLLGTSLRFGRKGTK
jgi:long-chain fatty acid transport protein